MLRMTRTQRSLTIGLWAFLVVGMLALVASGVLGRLFGGTELDIRGQVAEFSLIDQNGKPFTLQQIKGRPHVACFVFTTCQGPCPAMMFRMSQVQQETAGHNVGLLSITVDPDNDTPEMMKAFGKRFGADESRWTLLVGKRQETDRVRDSMLVGATPASGTTPIEHGTYLVLIDAQGRVRKHYSGQDDEGWRQICKDAMHLEKHGK